MREVGVVLLAVIIGIAVVQFATNIKSLHQINGKMQATTKKTTLIAFDEKELEK